jgi:hypothetical protein
MPDTSVNATALITALSPCQQDVLDAIARHDDGGGYPQRTLQPLLRLGLIEPYDDLCGTSPCTYLRIHYRLPTHVRTAYCEWRRARQEEKG